MLGIELNPYAAELARVSVWIGEIQWMRANGYDAGRDPILRPLDTIECRDAILNEDGTRADWPDADVVIGNPPFLGGKRMMRDPRRRLRRRALRGVEGPRSPEADLVMYWFASRRRACSKANSSRRARRDQLDPRRRKPQRLEKLVGDRPHLRRLGRRGMDHRWSGGARVAGLP